MKIDNTTKPTIRFERGAMVPGSQDSADHGHLTFDDSRVYLSGNHFKRIEGEPLKRKLFKDSVKMIAVEVFSYCNRTCCFCPNSGGSRLGDNEYLREEIYLRILEDLAGIGYDGRFMFHQYNEPLADRVILALISQAKERIPDADLIINTNGDHLSREYMAELVDAGVTHLSISIYDSGSFDFDEKRVAPRMHKMADKLGLENDLIRDREGYQYTIQSDFGSMKVSILGRDFNYVGYDRAGLIENFSQKTVRSSPCFAVFEEVHVDWRGLVKLCCNIYPDDPGHRRYLVGDLRDDKSIFDVFCQAPLIAWRTSLLRFHPSPTPCRSCNRKEFPGLATAENEGVVKQLLSRFIKDLLDTGPSAV